MAKLCSLFSGSDGNCTYISVRGVAFLVDAGVSARSILNALEKRGYEKEAVKGIFITHEHTDHVKGLKILLKTLNVPVFASEKTLAALFEKEILTENNITVAVDGDFEVQNIKVTRFATSHDCEGSSGYRFNLSGTCSVAVCTDLGFVSDEVLENLKGCRGMVIESNHDLKMLRDGPYPHELKLRVGSDHGHLSNNACAAILPTLFKSGTTRFILGHISRQNNTHAVALSCAKAALMDIGAVAGEDYLILCAGQYGCEEVVL
ncbi:MAG: MBL fold metallo-hydrolase [Clostridia bacterium]|nr:MBL fold metallo-hydrolase [Clostridia bacterium]